MWRETHAHRETDQATYRYRRQVHTERCTQKETPVERWGQRVPEIK